MNCDDDSKPVRKRPSNLTIGGIVSILGLAGSGIGAYSTLKIDIGKLQGGEVYQERTNERLSEELKLVRVEARETMREFNEKLDRIIDQRQRRR